jgi:hypothetical protein
VNALRRGRATPALVALLALLAPAAAGCSSEAEPSPMPTPSPSPSESASPTPKPPAMPAAAEGTSPAAAKAFVLHWVEALNYASATGDTAPVRAISAPACSSCEASFSRITQVYGAGGHITSEGWHVRSMQLVPGQPSTHPMVDVGVRLSPQVVVEERGAEPQDFDGGRLPMTFTLTWDSGKWRVGRLERSA